LFFCLNEYYVFEKNPSTNKHWVKPKAKAGTFINSYKYSKKFVQYGKDKE